MTKRYKVIEKDTEGNATEKEVGLRELWNYVSEEEWKKESRDSEHHHDGTRNSAISTTPTVTADPAVPKCANLRIFPENAQSAAERISPTSPPPYSFL